MKRWLAFAPLVVLALLGVLFFGYALKHDPHYIPEALVGKPVPALTLARLDGDGSAALRDQLQGPTFVNVFASWCVPCVQESPELLAMQAAGARLVGIAYRDQPDASRGFLRRYGDPYAAVLTDPDGRGGIELGVSGVPETFLVGNDGVILAKHSGPMTLADAQSMLVEAQGAIR